MNGDQNDWSYGGNSMQGIMAFTPEVDDNGFWGGQNDSTLIANFCEECRYMNIWLCMNAPSFVGIGDEGESQNSQMLAIESVTPNPVTGLAAFDVTVPVTAGVEIAVFDLSGRIVESVGTGGLTSGTSTLFWTVPDRMAAGVYLVRMTDGTGNVASRRFTVLR